MRFHRSSGFEQEKVIGTILGDVFLEGTGEVFVGPEASAEVWEGEGVEGLDVAFWWHGGWYLLWTSVGRDTTRGPIKYRRGYLVRT